MATAGVINVASIEQIRKKVSRLWRLFWGRSYSATLLRFDQACQMQFRVIQQLDHHLTDVAVEVMILQCGKRQEACACHNMNAVGRATQADERCIHFPFRGGVEE